MPKAARLLDDQSIIDFYNHSRVLDSAINFHRQCLATWEQSYEAIIPPDAFQAQFILFSGMGGSGIPGRVILSLSPYLLRVPVATHHTYHIPKFVNSSTLFVSCSYSGDTEETLTSLSEAREKGAQIFCITQGGKLKAQADLHHLPGFFFDPSTLNPSSQPRSGIGILLLSSLGLLFKANLAQVTAPQIMESIHYVGAQSGNFAPTIPLPQNPAKLLAQSLSGTLPILVTADHLVGSAHHFRNSLNETSKNLSYLYTIPELNHHLLEGLQFPPSNRHNLMFLFLESQLFHPEITKRFRLTKTILKMQGIPYTTFYLRSSNHLTQALELIQVANFTAFYLSVLNHLDPGPVPWVDYFKSHL